MFVGCSFGDLVMSLYAQWSSNLISTLMITMVYLKASQVSGITFMPPAHSTEVTLSCLNKPLPLGNVTSIKECEWFANKICMYHTCQDSSFTSGPCDL